MICYIVRDERLLVIKHLDEPWDESGLQVPAGSIKQGEFPEAAALREAREETGLREFRIVRKLGVTKYDMAPYRRGAPSARVPPRGPRDDPGALDQWRGGPGRWLGAEAL